MSMSETQQASLIAKMVSEGKLGAYQALTDTNVSQSLRSKVEDQLLRGAESIDLDEYHKNNAWRHGFSENELELVPKDEDINVGKSFSKKK